MCSVYTCPTLHLENGGTANIDGGQRERLRIEEINGKREHTEGKNKRLDGNFPVERPWGRGPGVAVTMMHGVTLLVMPALIYASGINEVAPLWTCHTDL